jgi:predicted phosphodiesterase
MKFMDGRSRFFSRRALPLLAVAALAACAPGPRPAAVPSAPPSVRFGIVTDVHYADVDPRGTRPYRESLAKLDECVAFMNAEAVDFLIELGDFKDQDDPPVEARTLAYLERIEGVYAAFRGPRYHVPGNHDHDSLSKVQFLTLAPNTGIPSDRSYYSFDRSGVRFVVLDACFTGAGAPYDHGNFGWDDCSLPAEELAWLRAALASGPSRAIVFIHQQLDGTGSYYVQNAAEARAILEASGRVLAVFQGHRHEGAYQRLAGIPYYTLVGLIEGSGPENNSYAVVTVGSSDEVSVRGLRKAESRDLRSSR